MKYDVLLTRDMDSGIYTAVVPDLPGFSCKGASIEDVKGIIQDAMNAWIANLQRTGQSVPPPADYVLDWIDVVEERPPQILSPVEEFAAEIHRIVESSHEARKEFVLADHLVADERFEDAVRHLEWCAGLLAEASDMLVNVRVPEGMERIMERLRYGFSMLSDGTGAALHGALDGDVDVVRRAEQTYLRGTDAVKLAMTDMQRSGLEP